MHCMFLLSRVQENSIPDSKQWTYDVILRNVNPVVRVEITYVEGSQ